MRPPQHVDPLRFSPSDWQADPAQAFESWLAKLDGRSGANFKHSSAGVYTAQWRQFIQYVRQNGLRLTEVSPADVSSFLDSLHSENRTQRGRIRRLLERAFNAMHEGTHSPTHINPAAPAPQEQGAAWEKVNGNLPKGFATLEERRILVDYLESDVKALTPTDRWRELRDRAMVAAFLGAGLKVSEATGLTVHCMAETDPVGWLDVTVLDSKHPRRVLPAPFAMRILRDWATQRTARPKSRLMYDDGDRPELFFPSQRARRIASVSAVRSAEAVVCASGLSGAHKERLSPQTMRNSFIAEQFELGRTVQEVTFTLGFDTVLTAERFKQAWERWKERQ